MLKKILQLFLINVNLDSFLEKASFLVAVSQLFAPCCWVIDDLDSPLGFACVDVVLVESFHILPDGQIQFKFRKQVIES